MSSIIYVPLSHTFFFFNDATELKASFFLRDECQRVEKKRERKKEEAEGDGKKKQAEIWKCHIDRNTVVKHGEGGVIGGLMHIISQTKL